MTNALNISSGPHVRDRWTTPFIMYMVCLALLPAAVVGVIVNGLNALWIILIAIVALMILSILLLVGASLYESVLSLFE